MVGFDKKDLLKKDDDFYEIYNKDLVSDNEDENHNVGLRISNKLYDVINDIVSSEGFVDSGSQVIRAFLVLGFNIFRQKNMGYKNYSKLVAKLNLKEDIDLRQSKRFKFSLGSDLDMRFDFRIINYINNAICDEAKKFRFGTKSDFKRYLICLGINDTYTNSGVVTELGVFNSRFDTFIDNLDNRLNKINDEIIEKYVDSE